MKKTILVTTIIAITSLIILISFQSFAQMHQFGGQIASDSPIDFKSGKNKVWFLSEGTKVVGNLYLPQSYKKGDKLSAILVIGPKGAVKEQTQGIYAKKLSENGFITLAIDHRTYGESEGLPRHYENP
jgi:hypothetical protein